MKPKVIHVISDPPDYQAYRNSPRPEVNWDLPNNLWVGIWGTDWADLLVIEILKISDQFDIEVWQPDARADKIYSHTFSNGLTHKLIPAESIKKCFGLKKVDIIKSPLSIKMIKEEAKNKSTILHLHGNLESLNLDILESKNIPYILHTYHGDISLPYNEVFKLRKNIPAIFNIVIDYFKLKSSIKNVNYLTYMNRRNLNSLEEIYKGPKESLSMGCDFNFWKPHDKKQFKKEMNLPLDKIVILSSSRLTKAKQIDKFIKIFNELKNRKNFYLVFTGHGDEKHENYLKEISKDLINEGLLRFTGFVDVETLLKYYSASDIFAITSVTEGAPVAVMKAFACELPIFSTEVGHSAGLLKEYNVGKLVDPKNYNQWKIEIEKILNGEKLKILDRKIAQKYYDWPSVANKFLNIYTRILKNS